MKTVAIVMACLVLAGPARAGSVNGKQQIEAAASAQLPAALGANGGLKVEGVAGGVAQSVTGTIAATQSGPWSVSSAARCPSGTHLESVRAAPSGANVSLTLTAMCPGGTCAGCSVENIDATNACAVAFNASDASEGRILYSAAHPTLENSFGSWAYESSVTSIRVATSGISDPESRTIGACDLQVTCCGQ